MVTTDNYSVKQSPLSGPPPVAQQLADEANGALTGWNKTAIDLAGTKDKDGKSNLDKFNNALKTAGGDPAKAEVLMQNLGMSKDDADKALKSFTTLRAVENKNNDLVREMGQKFKDSLSSADQQKYASLQQTGDKKAIANFENSIAEKSPTANQVLLVKRQAEGDSGVMTKGEKDIAAAGNNVKDLQLTTVGTTVNPADENTFRASTGAPPLDGGQTAPPPQQPRNSFLDFLRGMYSQPTGVVE